MKQTNLRKTYALALILAFATGAMLTGCAEKDLYDPDYGKQELPDVGTLPDFNTRTTVALTVDYEEPGFKTLVEVYTEYPYERSVAGNVVRKDVLPVYAAYTDDNAKLSAQLQLPAAVKQVYLCCPSMGMPQCIALDVTGDKIDFKMSDLYAGDDVDTRASIGSPNGGKVPWDLESDRLWSLCKWSNFGKPTADGSGLYFKKQEPTQAILEEVRNILWNGQSTKPNSGLQNDKYAREAKYTNISIAEWVKNEAGETVPVENATIRLVFLQEAAWDQNVFGYYYYPTGQAPATAADIEKYVVFPNVSTAGTPPFDSSDKKKPSSTGNAPLKKGQKVTLLYKDSQGRVSESFPPGYTIGWFIIANGYESNPKTINTDKTWLYSNETWNSGGEKRCIALNYHDEKVVLGFEDKTDNSFEDLLFYVESDPRGAIITGDQPVIKPGEPGIELPDVTSETQGTLAFEDIWPGGGDYDMNDVVVEYSRKVTVDKDNKVKRVVDTFKPVQLVGSAAFNNAFAYQVDPAQVGTYTALPEGTSWESATNSFIVFANAKEVKDQAFVVTREFDGSFAQDQLKAYNPFIIVKYVPGSTSRTEVHLPKQKATDYADKTLTGSADEAYYINRNGKYPFAIDLPTWGFGFVTEGSPIGSQGEYPKFNSWVEKGCGTTDADWYLHK